MITILTPTYNRAHTLKSLYNSLRKQNINFEWVIIDDGSDDRTKELVNEFQAQNNNFNIKYFFQKNQGKHVAINLGVQRAEGDWIFIVDSDDYLVDNALEVVNGDIEEYGDTYQLCYRKKLSDNQIVGALLNENTYCTSATNAGKIFKGDLAYVFKRDVLKIFPFPNISIENFVPELYIWNKISDLHKILFFAKKAIYICEYLDDGYTKKFKMNLKRNPIGFLIFYRDQLRRESGIIRKFKCFIRCIQCVIYLK